MIQFVSTKRGIVPLLEMNFSLFNLFLVKQTNKIPAEPFNQRSTQSIQLMLSYVKTVEIPKEQNGQHTLGQK